MNWRQLMGTDEHFGIQEQKEQKEQKEGGKEASATIAPFALKGREVNNMKGQDKSQGKNVNPGPDMRTVTVLSRVLNREVFISWEGDKPETVLFEGMPYTLDEIAKLKEMPLTPEDLRTIHRVKTEFKGEIE